MISLITAFQCVSQLWDAPEERIRLKTHGSAEKAAREIGVPCIHAKENLWQATATKYHGFTVKLDILAHKHFVVLVAFAGVTTRREWILRDLAIALLEFNQRLAFGSFRLDEHESGMSILLGYVCDTRQCDSPHVSAAAREIMAEMQRSLVELYARDLIVIPLD